VADGYAHPEVLVDTHWVAEHLNDANVRLVEADEDILLYEQGHIPGTVKLDWQVDVQNPVQRDFLDKAAVEKLLSGWGIANDTTVVFYGDKSNWYACYAFWLFSYFCHPKMHIMDGGRQKWIDEGREMTREAPSYPAARYHAEAPDETIRAYRDDVFKLLNAKQNGLRRGAALVDVRSPQEYRGEVLHMIGYPQEGARRAGHVPGASSIPWGTATNSDGTFKSRAELEEIYGSQEVTPDKDVVAYCRIGERSSHTWFVLTHLLGYPRVRNYDGSWTEWGSMVRAPIERDV
jgi:thiosulfate/3-mercaptopyruvate sulfurtransferase